MEYLSRILKEVSNRRGFKFHDRCANLKLNHLCFANDLLLFCHGNYISILLMLQGLKLFSSTSGLILNEEKTVVYCSGMEELEINRVIEVSGYKRAQLSFRYLGIPIFSKKLSDVECRGLVERMVKRIQVWRSRNLSYMARLTLVNAVLLSIHSYWAQLTVLPIKFFHEVE